MKFIKQEETKLPKSASRRRSAINWIYCEDGRITSTKRMFVR